jgi:IS5 family transposase
MRDETFVFADAGYRGIEKREENVERKVTWHVAMKRGQRKALKGAYSRAILGNALKNHRLTDSPGGQREVPGQDQGEPASRAD